MFYTAIEYSSSRGPIPRVIEASSVHQARIVERFDSTADRGIRSLADRPGLTAALSLCRLRGYDLFLPCTEGIASDQELAALSLFLGSHCLRLLAGPLATPLGPPADEDAQPAIAEALALSVAAVASWPGLQERLVSEVEAFLELRARLMDALNGAVQRIQDAPRDSSCLTELLHLQVIAHQYAEGRAMPTLDGSTAEMRVTSCAAVAGWMTARGFTQAEVAAYLNARGERSRTGRLWSQALISHLLKEALR